MIPGKKNIVIAGYPKSGTVWLTRLTAQLMDCPSLGFWGFENSAFAQEGLKRDSDYACYQSHHLFGELPKAWDKEIYRIIYLVRDPRDIIISGAYHFNFYHFAINKFIRGRNIEKSRLGKSLKIIDLKLMTTRAKIKRMTSILKFGDPTFPSLTHPWDKHVSSYLNESVLIIRYEDLLSDTFNNAKKILRFLSHEKDDTRILKDIENQSFVNKKRELMALNNMEKVRHLRSGQVGNWKQYLTEVENTKIKAHLNSVMPQLGYIN